MHASTFIWAELMSRDPEASERFYERVVGLSSTRAGGDDSDYRILVADGRPVAGLTGPRPDSEIWPSGGPAGHWVGYFQSSDVDTAAGLTTELGGSVLVGPIDIPGTGRVAVLRDPDGATFGLFDPAAQATG